MQYEIRIITIFIIKAPTSPPYEDRCVFVGGHVSAMSWYRCGDQGMITKATRKTKQTQHIIPFIGACASRFTYSFMTVAVTEISNLAIYLLLMAVNRAENVQLLGLW